MNRDQLRRAVRSARAYARRPGRLPEFLIIGGQRCGTTSLYRYLADHPSVRPAIGKELQYFSLHHDRGERWYRGHFPRRPDAVRSFEASPYYLFDPAVPARVAATLPAARFVALVRDPVERAWSHYLHSRRYGIEPLSFADALDAEPERLASGGRREYSYQARGFYAEQLERWYAAIDPARILVVRTERLNTDYPAILDFLGLPPHVPADFGRHTRRTGDAPVPAELRDRLIATFAADQARLDRLLP